MIPDRPSACQTCRSLTGAARISPGQPIGEGQYWVIEHAYSAAHRGWLVIVLKRHATALHDLTAPETAELGVLLGRAAHVLRDYFGCEKEYLAGFAEKPGFQHVHLHLVQKPPDLPAAYQATRIFALLDPPPAAAVPPDEIRTLCLALRAQFAAAE